MAIDLIIRASGVMYKEELDFHHLLRTLRLEYGTYSPFFILEEKYAGNAGLLYSPHRLSRGIYFDGKNMNEGEVRISFNLPSTPSEIKDVMAIVSEIRRQYLSIEITCKEQTMTCDDFLAREEYYLNQSRDSLRNCCQSKQYEAAILTLVTFPYTLTPDEMDYFATEGTLEDFEILIHQKQLVDAHYLCPKLMSREADGAVVAFYTITEEIPTIVPIECSCFLSLEQVQVQQGYVRFYIHSKRRVMEGYYDYDCFIKVLLDFGAEYFDGDHLLLPAFTLAELVEIARATKDMQEAIP